MHNTGCPVVDIGGSPTYIGGPLFDTGDIVADTGDPLPDIWAPLADTECSAFHQHRRPPGQCKEALDGT